MARPILEFHVLRICLYLLGTTAVGIALSGFFLGLRAIDATEWLFDQLARAPHRASAPVSATYDSEFRFYSVLWFSYGAAMLWTARRLADQLSLVIPFALIFLVGGLGRLISDLAVGPPHPAFIALTVPELVLPPLVIVLVLRIRASRH